MSMWVCIYLLAFAQNIQTVLWYQEHELTMNSLQWTRDPWSFTIQTQLMWSNTFLTLLLVSAWLSSVDMLAPQLKLWSSKLGLFLHHPQLQVLDPCVWNLGWPMDSVMLRAVWKVSVLYHILCIAFIWHGGLTSSYFCLNRGGGLQLLLHWFRLPCHKSAQGTRVCRGPNSGKDWSQPCPDSWKVLGNFQPLSPQSSSVGLANWWVRVSFDLPWRFLT